jgi:hypothetical protein
MLEKNILMRLIAEQLVDLLHRFNHPSAVGECVNSGERANRSVRKRQNKCVEENESVYFVLVFLIVSLILDKFVKEKYVSDKRLSATVSAQTANP